MTVALYPTTINPLLGYSVEPMFSTQRTPTKSGADVAEKLWDTARYRIRLPYRVSVTDAATLLNFHEARYGAYEAFDFFDFHSRAWVGLDAGVTAGIQNQGDLPFKNGASYTVYVDDVEKTAGTDYVINTGVGTNGRDTLTWAVGKVPTADLPLIINVTANRVFTVRFDSDNLPYKTLPQFSGGVEMLDLQVTLLSQR